MDTRNSVWKARTVVVRAAQWGRVEERDNAGCQGPSHRCGTQTSSQRRRVGLSAKARDKASRGELAIKCQHVRLSPDGSPFPLETPSIPNGRSSHCRSFLLAMI